VNAAKATEEKTPVKATEEKAPVKATEEKAPVKATEEKAPVKATEEKAPVKVTEEKAPVKATEEKAPVKVTEEKTPVKVTEEKTPVKATEEKSPVKAAEPVVKTNSVAKRWDPKANAAKEKEVASPVKAEDLPPPEPAPSIDASEAGLTYVIGGQGKAGGNEGRMIIFSVNFKIDGKLLMNIKKDEIGVHVECPGDTPRFNIMISNCAYHIGFTPSAGGQHWFDFTYKGQWANEPFCLQIKNKLNQVPDHPYTGANRGGA